MNASRADILAFLGVVRTCRRVGRVRIAEKAREEVALHGWEDEDVYLFLDDLGPDDFLRREAPRYGAFDAIWVFTPDVSSRRAASGSGWPSRARPSWSS